ncbi:MAG TPA: hypothetical protein VK543_09220 [Puia sp.]|nr:hypothetical protein [Puia sp.]
MDTTINYSGFDRDINEAFAPIIQEFSFGFNKIYEGCYELGNSKCILRFTFDRGDVACNIRKVGSPELTEEGVFPILSYLFPEFNDSDDEKIYDARLQLFKYAEIIASKLKNVIQGDFSWLKGYIEEKNKFEKLIHFVWNDLDKNSSIYKKFAAGDVAWIKDLKEFLQKNDINL